MADDLPISPRGTLLKPQIAADINVKKQDVADEKVSFALNYLSYYHWNPNTDGASLTAELVAQYVRQFKQTVGLPVDDVIDGQTVKAMEFLPRCGLPDYKMMAEGPLAAKWGITEIKYFIEKYVTGLSPTDQDTLLQLAWTQWMEVANLKLTRVSSANQANIIISTGRGQGDQFDGPGNTLAWAYLPQTNSYTGKLLMRFDLDETWIKIRTDRGILYLNVATHEFGHLLGLDHSQIKTALMAPYYAVDITKPQDNDDVSRIRKLYGPALSPPVTPPVNPPIPGQKIKVECYVNSLSDIKIDGKTPDNFVLL